MIQAISKDYDKRMDNPTNGVSIWGCLRPAFPDEESYLRRLLHNEDDDYNVNLKGTCLAVYFLSPIYQTLAYNLTLIFPENDALVFLVHITLHVHILTHTETHTHAYILILIWFWFSFPLLKQPPFPHCFFNFPELSM